MAEKRNIIEAAAPPLSEITQQAIFLLVRAIGSLKRKEKLFGQLFENEEPSIEEISDLEHAVLRLCEISEETESDTFLDFFAAIDEDSDEEDARLLVARIRALAGIESIEFSLDDGSVGGVVPPEKRELARALFPRGSQSY